MLGADLIGFHIQSHCNNFLQTVDRIIESRIDWEHSPCSASVIDTWCGHFPSAWSSRNLQPAHESAYEERATLAEGLGVEAAFPGCRRGPDGLHQRHSREISAVERFLEKYPRYQGEFTFVQVGAPSRTHIKRYHDLQAEVEAEADRINWRFQADKWKPIVLLNRQHSHAEIAPYYRAADLCLVTSLHDGMNLVAKEFVASAGRRTGSAHPELFYGSGSRACGTHCR